MVASAFSSVLLAASVSSSRVGSAATQTDRQPAATSKSSQPNARPTATVIRGEGWAIAAPDDWTRFSGVRPPMQLYLIGDRKKGIPSVDGTLSAFQAGLTVEVLPAREGLTPRKRAEKDLDVLKGTLGFEIIAEPETKEIELTDGTKAVALKVEVAKARQRRLSFYEKVYCALPGNQHVVATSFLTCSPGGGRFVKKMALSDFVGAHAESLVLDEGKLNRARLEAAYKSVDMRVEGALRKAQQGNQFLETKANDHAALAFREALEICEFLPAAHNGLAWALLQAEGKKAQEQAEAMQHAESAVKLTDRRDPSALDTLALAYFRKGDKTNAIATLREALKLDPENPGLRRSLQTYKEMP